MSCENCCECDDDMEECGCCERFSKFKESLKKKRSFVYEVWRDSPCGNITMGVYSTLKKAERKKKSWNDSTSYFLDQASIYQRKVE